jgi:hypothetical protein
LGAAAFRVERTFFLAAFLAAPAEAFLPVLVEARGDAALRVVVPALRALGAAARLLAFDEAVLPAVVDRRDEPAEVLLRPPLGAAGRRPEPRAAGRPVFRFAITPPRLP